RTLAAVQVALRIQRNDVCVDGLRHRGSPAEIDDSGSVPVYLRGKCILWQNLSVGNHDKRGVRCLN
ncbi:MAG TPA: hypothetical protein VJN44_21770, partial [Roseateles sp.]|nr:hypothetical protein [Roseateles sp.]